MILDATTPDHAPLAAFRERVLADESLQQALVGLSSEEEFAERASALASAQGIDLPTHALTFLLRDDPLGLSRWTAQPVLGKEWPGPEWLPIEVQVVDGMVYVDWAHFGGKRLTEAFYVDTVRTVLRHPFNKVFRYRISLADLVAAAGRQQTRPPSGFIFHMSRCGSTLVAQMLAAVPRNVVVSEARPIDALAQLCRFSPDMPSALAANIVRAAVLAFGRRQATMGGHFLVKLDSWHSLLLPFFRLAFPEVPWVFLYREPVEVLVSQMRQRGSQMVPALVSPALYGIDHAENAYDEMYCARVLEKICEAAAAHYSEGGGLLVNYHDLPDALFAEILPHFGISFDAEDRESMASAARLDAKSKGQVFATDGEAKRREVTAAIQDASARHLEGVYRRLEMLRANRPSHQAAAKD